MSDLLFRPCQACTGMRAKHRGMVAVAEEIGIPRSQIPQLGDCYECKNGFVLTAEGKQLALLMEDYITEKKEEIAKREKERTS